jgi:hypothetical protein
MSLKDVAQNAKQLFTGRKFLLVLNGARQQGSDWVKRDGASYSALRIKNVLSLKGEGFGILVL